MSRAFINKGEQWGYCSKSGEHCMYADHGKECHREECEFVNAKPVEMKQTRDRIVRRSKTVDRDIKGAGSKSADIAGAPGEQSGASKRPDAATTRPVKTKQSPMLRTTTPAARRRALQEMKERKTRIKD